MKKIISMLLVIALALACAVAFADEDLQAQLDAANARIAELEAQVAVYKPVYDSRLAATYGDGDIIWVDEIEDEYASMVAMYKQYGIDVEAFGMGDSLRQSIIEQKVQTAVLNDYIAELGLDAFTDEELAAIAAAAEATYAQYIDSYMGSLYPDAEEITDEMRQNVAAYLAQGGLTKDALIEEMKPSKSVDKLRAHITDGIDVSDEELQAAYEALIEANKTAYADDRSFNNDRNGGAVIAWMPEGYRAVKQILVSFDDDQKTRYADISGRLSALNIEKTAPAAEGEEKRSDEAIDADIAAANAELEALYAELQPAADEVIAAFNNGESLESLIEKYNSDPGMTSGITAEQGYAVCANSATYDPAFVEAAMSIENIGELSAPTDGSYGKYIVYYLGDIPAGEVALDEIRDALYQNTLSTKLTKTYDDQVAAWIEAVAPEYFPENVK